MGTTKRKRDSNGRYAYEGGPKSPDLALKEIKLIETSSEDLPKEPNVDTLYNTYQHLSSSVDQNLGEKAQNMDTTQLDSPIEHMANTHYPYHKAFVEFPEKLLSETKRVFRSRPSQLSHEEVHEVFTRWIKQVSHEYRVPVPELHWDPTIREETGGGMYARYENTIYLSHTSITTLLHEYRHHLQAQDIAMIHPDLEEDARAWSLSLYSMVRPKLFEKLVREGRILHINQADL